MERGRTEERERKQDEPHGESGDYKTAGASWLRMQALTLIGLLGFRGRARVLKSRRRLPYCLVGPHGPVDQKEIQHGRHYPLYPARRHARRLLRGFFVRPVTSRAASDTAPFRVEIAENENAYVLRGELPGVKKDDINISIDGDQVAISAEVKNEKEVKDGERVLRSERYYGKVYRAFPLGQAVDENAAEAKYSDGVLELTLPEESRGAGEAHHHPVTSNRRSASAEQTAGRRRACRLFVP